MAIETNAAIDVFGTQDTAITTNATIANGSFSTTAQATTWTNDDDVREASAVFTGAYGSAPNANSSVALFARLMNIDGTSDQPVPDGNFQHRWCGSFPLNDQTASQSSAIDITLPNTKTSQDYEFYIQNNAGQTLSSGATVKITPKTLAPHA